MHCQPNIREKKQNKNTPNKQINQCTTQATNKPSNHSIPPPPILLAPPTYISRSSCLRLACTYDQLKPNCARLSTTKPNQTISSLKSGKNSSIKAWAYRPVYLLASQQIHGVDISFVSLCSLFCCSNSCEVITFLFFYICFNISHGLLFRFYIIYVADHKHSANILFVQPASHLTSPNNYPTTPVPHHTTSCHTTPHHTTHTTSRYTTPHYTTPHHTILHHTNPHHATLHHITLFHAIPRHPTPHQTTPYQTTSHYTTSHHTTPTPHHTRPWRQ